MDYGLLRVDSTRVGDALFRNVIVNHGNFGGRNLDGLFALNAFYDVLLTIDPSHKRVRFTRGSLSKITRSAARMGAQTAHPFPHSGISSVKFV